MKYVPGPMFGQFSGSQGNTTASHNRFGSYTRNRTIPTNPNTTKQTLSRQLLAQLASDYRDLTQAQRDAWKALGEEIVRLDTQGQPYTLTGLQAYQMVNRLRISAGLASVTAAPALDTESNLTTLGLAMVNALGVLTATVTFTPDPLAANTRLYVYATAYKSQGRQFFSRSEYRLITVGAAATDSPLDIASAYSAVFGVPPTGSKVSIRCMTVSPGFFPGVEMRADAIVT